MSKIKRRSLSGLMGDVIGRLQQRLILEILIE